MAKKRTLKRGWTKSMQALSADIAKVSKAGDVEQVVMLSRLLARNYEGRIEVLNNRAIARKSGTRPLSRMHPSNRNAFGEGY